MRKLWCLEMVNFIEVLEDIGCFGFWDVSMYACPCQFGTDLALIEQLSWSGLMKLSDPPFDFVTKMLILPNSGN